MNIEIANRLVALRRAQGLSQEELAGRLGLSRQAVSKWERGEASPDTDNLIALAELYGVTLDELVRGKPTPPDGEVTSSVDEPAVAADEDMDGNTDNEDGDDADGNEDEDATGGSPRQKGHLDWRDIPHKNGHIDWSGLHIHDGADEVHIGWKGIHVRDKEDEVHISWKDGVHVTSADGDRVHVSRDGVHVDEGGESGTHVHMEGEAFQDWKREHWHYFLAEFPCWLFATLAFLLLGFLGGWWHPGWLVFFLIPLYQSAVEAIYKRNANHFAYPVLAAGVYLAGGFLYNWWHPGWVIFLTIPLYYGVAAFWRKK